LGATAPIIIHLDQPLMIRLVHAFVLEPATKSRTMLVKLRDGPPRLASSAPEHLLISRTIPAQREARAADKKRPASHRFAAIKGRSLLLPLSGAHHAKRKSLASKTLLSIPATAMAM
jgi:hypothetical protein